MPPATETLDRVKAATVYIRCRLGDDWSMGSGFFVHAPGYVVTNAHVVTHSRKKGKPADKVEVVVASGTSEQRTLRAQIMGFDVDADLALLKVTDANLPTPLQFGKADHLIETEDVLLFGFPLGEFLGENISVNKTTVSSIRRKGRDITTVQFAGGSFFGSSGGPVTNMSGEVVGVCQGGIGGSQINFAIPAETATAFVAEQIRTGGSRKLSSSSDYTDSELEEPSRSRRRRGRRDEERRPSRARTKPTPSTGPFASIPTWALLLWWLGLTALSVAVVLAIGSENRGLQRFVGIFMNIFACIPLKELWDRCWGFSAYNPNVGQRPAPSPLLSEAQLASVPAAPATGNDPRLRDGPVDGPPEEEFWEQYNRRLEFPLATVGAVFLHILIFALFVYILVGLMGGEDRSNPPLQLVQVGGLDDTGEGSAGSGGQPDPDIERNVDPIKDVMKQFATPEALKEAKENLQKVVLDDPAGKLPISAPNVKAYSDLDETIRKKLLGVGSNKGDGNQAGKGFDGTPGTGPGGTGADSTRARGLRWVLRFRITSGNDYISQLRAMGAEILVPLPPDNKKCLIIRDLDNPRPVVATDADLNRLAGKIQFSDNRPQPVREVLSVLNVDTSAGQPKAFWAFFPKEVEEDLARKEKAYRNRRPEDIEETIFRVTIRGGSFEVVVDDQVFKK